MWRRFWNWLRGQPAGRLGSLTVTLYTRRGCHLCEIAQEYLQREQVRCGFRLERIDVDSAPEWAALYGEKVPVVALDGKVRFHGEVNPLLLRRLLDAQA